MKKGVSMIAPANLQMMKLTSTAIAGFDEEDPEKMDEG